MYNLERFIKAQDGENDFPIMRDVYDELMHSRKITHWIWYVFPQLAGIGHSELSKRYAISGLDEARAYLEHPILSLRLKNVVNTLMIHRKSTIDDIFPLDVDVKKVHACLTLFDYICPDDIFAKALAMFFNNTRHQQTLKLIDDYVQRTQTSQS